MASFCSSVSHGLSDVLHEQLRVLSVAAIFVIREGRQTAERVVASHTQYSESVSLPKSKSNTTEVYEAKQNITVLLYKQKRCTNMMTKSDTRYHLVAPPCCRCHLMFPFPPYSVSSICCVSNPPPPSLLPLYGAREGCWRSILSELRDLDRSSEGSPPARDY